MSSKKIDIRSLKKNELIKFLNDFNYEPYRAQQILGRVNSQQIDSFEKIILEAKITFFRSSSE